MHQKAFGSNFACIPRYLMTEGGRPSTMVNSQSYQRQRVMDEEQQIVHSPTSDVFNTYGGYVGLKHAAIINDNHMDSNDERHFYSQNQQPAYSQNFPRSKSTHTVGYSLEEGRRSRHNGSLTIAGMNLESTSGRNPGVRDAAVDLFIPTHPDPNVMEAESMSLLILPENEDNLLLNEPLGPNENAPSSSISDPFSNPNKLAASAYREASFV